MTLREEDLFEEDDNQKVEKPKEIELKVDSKFGPMSKTIRLTYKTGYLIVQTDKPLYTPRENGNLISNFKVQILF